MVYVKAIIAFICYLFQFVVSENELRFAFTFWRHGARVPDRGVSAINVDFLGNTWNLPEGELLSSGMRMHYLLGYLNRKRWVTDEVFLSSSYKPNELYVKSTGFNVTKMSVLSNLQGLYPADSGPELTLEQSKIAYPPTPEGFYDTIIDDVNLGDKFDVNSKYRPYALPHKIQVIPVHSFSHDGDMFFFTNSEMCPSFTKILTDNAKSEISKKVAADFNTRIGNTLKAVLEIKDDNFFLSFLNVYLAADSYISGYSFGQEFKKIKDFFKVEADLNNFLEEFILAAEDYHINYIFDYYNGNYLVSRIMMTPFYNDAIRWMETRISYDKDDKGYTGYAAPKLVIYSTHDTNLGAAHLTLKDAFELTSKPMLTTKFASNFIFELRRPKNKDVSLLTEKDYTVDILYNHELYHSVEYTTFKENLEKKVIMNPEELSQFCGWNQSDAIEMDSIPESYINATIILSLLVFIAIITVIVLIRYLIRKHKTYSISNTDNVIHVV
jgi:hypothetical protein